MESNPRVSWGSITAVVIDEYDHLPKLLRLRHEIKQAAQLLANNGFDVAEVTVEPGTKSMAILASLREVQPSARRLLLYWGGHGKSLSADEFYLCGPDTPVRRAPADHNAISASALGRLLADLRIPETVLIMDVCGAGGGAEAVVHAFRTRVGYAAHQGARPSLSVISSARSLQKAREAAFSTALLSVLRDGPPPDSSYVPWTDRDKYLTPNELTQAIGIILRDQESAGVQEPDHDMAGAVGRFFLNPRYREHVPDVNLERGQDSTIAALTMTAEVAEHFMLKFRGIDAAGDPGWFFTGRTNLLRRLVRWLRDGNGMFVVTGDPGSGKSAVLGRLALMSDARYRAELTNHGAFDVSDDETVPDVGSISAGVHGKNKTLLECVLELGAALNLRPPIGGWQSAADLIYAMAEPVVPRTILFDALDEATDLFAISSELLAPLSRLPETRVLVGTRPGLLPDPASHALVGTASSLLHALGASESQTVWLNDDPDQMQDIADYSWHRLVFDRGSLYEDKPALARPVARAIASKSSGIFLFARLMTRAIGRRSSVLDLQSVEAHTLLSGGVEDAFAADLARYESDEVCVRAFLRALAWSEGAGLPRRDLWLEIVNAMAGTRFTESDLSWVLQHAGSHIVASAEDGQTVYRLYHQSFADYFRGSSQESQIHNLITDALLNSVVDKEGTRNWRAANPYIHRHLSSHAAAASRLGELTEDFGFLVFAEPRKLQHALGSLDPQSRPLLRVYWRALHELADTTPDERMAILSGICLRDEPDAIAQLPVDSELKWRPLWQHARKQSFQRAIGGHGYPALCIGIGRYNSREIAITGGGDHAVRVWDAQSGDRLATLLGHRAPILSVVGMQADGRELVASGDSDGVVSLFDLADGKRIANFKTSSGAAISLASVRTMTDGSVLCVGDEGGLVQALELPSLKLIRKLDPQHHATRAIAFVEAHRLVLTGGDDGQIAVWSSDDLSLLHLIDTTGYVLCLAAADVGGRLVAAVGGLFGVLSLWDVRTKTHIKHFPVHHGAINSAAFINHRGRQLLASAGEDGGVHLWDPLGGDRITSLQTSRILPLRIVEKLTKETAALAPAGGSIGRDDTEQERISALVTNPTILSLGVASRASTPVLTTAGIDGVIRLWDIDMRRDVGQQRDAALSVVAAGSRLRVPVVATGSRGGVITVMDAASGATIHRLTGITGPTESVSIGNISGRDYVVASGQENTLRYFDLETGLEAKALRHKNGKTPVFRAQFLHADDRTVLVHTTEQGVAIKWDDAAEAFQFRVGDAAVSMFDACFAHGSLLLASTTLDGRLTLTALIGQNRSSRDLWLELPWHRHMTALAISTVGGRETLAVGDRDRGLWLWDLSADSVAETPTRLNRRVSALAFGTVAGGTVLAAGSTDGSVVIVDPASGSELLDLPRHNARIRSLAFTQYGKNPMLVSASDDGIQAVGLNDHDREFWAKAAPARA